MVDILLEHNESTARLIDDECRDGDDENSDEMNDSVDLLNYLYDDSGSISGEE